MRSRRFSALLNVAPVAGPGDTLPPLWHWLSFLAWPCQDELGTDGHPAAGPFLPPIPDRRRMFAGGRVQYPGILRVGDKVRRLSSLKDCVVKRGRSGELVFVTVRSEFRQGGELRVVEELDYVYRSGKGGVARQRPESPASSGTWEMPHSFDALELFMFSALTANTHRIHYDADYATAIEGYPDLVVQGPLQVLLMAELVRRHTTRPLASVDFRLHQPTFTGDTVVVRGRHTGPDVIQASVDRASGGRQASMKVTF